MATTVLWAEANLSWIIIGTPNKSSWSDLSLAARIIIFKQKANQVTFLFKILQYFSFQSESMSATL